MDVFIKPNSSEEKKYLKKYHIYLNRLKNGIIVVGVPKLVSDLRHTEISLNFPQGAYLDPQGKEGLTHLLEHFFNQSLREDASHLDVDLNAYTSSVSVAQTIKGIANPDYRKFGIWPLLTKIRRAIYDPLAQVKDLEERIKAEKKTVKAEITERHSNHDFWVWKNIRDDVLNSDNPETSQIVGTHESLDKITIKDLKKKQKELLISPGLIIDIAPEGTLEMAHKIGEEMSKLFSDFREGKLPNLEAIWGKRENINPDFKAGKLYLHNTKLNNKLITITYVWVFDRVQFDPSSFALWRMVPYLNDRLFRAIRKKGISYVSDVSLWTPEKIKTIFTITINIPKTDEIKKISKDDIFPYIKKEVLNLGETDAKRICDIEEKRRQSRPIFVSDIMHWAYTGIREYGQIIDADMIGEVYGQIKPKHIMDWTHKINNTKPAIIITGDLE